jgi:hypothetical protein
MEDRSSRYVDGQRQLDPLQPLDLSSCCRLLVKRDADGPCSKDFLPFFFLDENRKRFMLVLDTVLYASKRFGKMVSNPMD